MLYTWEIALFVFDAQELTNETLLSYSPDAAASLSKDRTINQQYTKARWATSSMNKQLASAYSQGGAIRRSAEGRPFLVPILQRATNAEHDVDEDSSISNCACRTIQVVVEDFNTSHSGSFGAMAVLKRLHHHSTRRSSTKDTLDSSSSTRPLYLGLDIEEVPTSSVIVTSPPSHDEAFSAPYSFLRYVKVHLSRLSTSFTLRELHDMCSDVEMKLERLQQLLLAKHEGRRGNSLCNAESADASKFSNLFCSSSNSSQRSKDVGAPFHNSIDHGVTIDRDDDEATALVMSDRDEATKDVTSSDEKGRGRGGELLLDAAKEDPRSCAMFFEHQYQRLRDKYEPSYSRLMAGPSNSSDAAATLHDHINGSDGIESSSTKTTPNDAPLVVIGEIILRRWHQQWTYKEALLKALGVGIPFGVRRIEVLNNRSKCCSSERVRSEDEVREKTQVRREGAELVKLSVYIDGVLADQWAHLEALSEKDLPQQQLREAANVGERSGVRRTSACLSVGEPQAAFVGAIALFALTRESSYWFAPSMRLKPFSSAEGNTSALGLTSIDRNPVVLPAEVLSHAEVALDRGFLDSEDHKGRLPITRSKWIRRVGKCHFDDDEDCGKCCKCYGSTRVPPLSLEVEDCPVREHQAELSPLPSDEEQCRTKVEGSEAMMNRGRGSESSPVDWEQK